MEAQNTQPAVAFRSASVTFGGSTVVVDLTLDVASGETLVLLGRSGSGKTTTLRLVNRLLEPSSGTVVVGGKPTTEWDPIRLRRGIGYVIQETGLLPHFTVARNVGLVPEIDGWQPARIAERTGELLELVGLDPAKYAHRYPSELSGGQRQRVGVARALAADPPILLMDEPFGALDPLTRAEMQREFRELAERLRKTIIFVTHDVAEAFALATRIGLFREGRLVELAMPDDFRRSTDPEALAFLTAAIPANAVS